MCSVLCCVTVERKKKCHMVPDVGEYKIKYLGN